MSQSELVNAAGKTVASVESSRGWPVLVFTDGTLVMFTSEYGSDPVCVEYREAVPDGWLDRVPGRAE